jgi:hypothetical protein
MTKFLLICLLLLASLPSKTERFDTCEGLKLSIERSQERIASISVDGGVPPIYFIFFYPDGRLVDKKRNIKSGSVEDFAKGKYVCAVTDESGCSKKIEFEIE